MSTTAQAVTKPKRNRLQKLLDQLVATERALVETQRHSAFKRPRGAKRLAPEARREIQKVFQLADNISAKLQVLRGAVEPDAQAVKPPSRQVAAVKKPASGPARDDVRATFEGLLEKGALLESAQFQERAGITRQALSKAVTAKRMFYLEVGGIRAYPAFYLDDSLERVQVEAVTKLLGDLSGGSKWLFFMTPKGSLAKAHSGRARTPLQALMDGDFEKVKQTAAGHAER
ncbi:hypothetical protein [Roseateles sp.]|uniref:hypothetical protein n=1 Tax=Roseateles sp. TaxID=1971397 RepID=UPI0025DCCDD7|nr:hypothetical protein [Roseateles sp.]MBV8036366.1 hypothetical protein [Roseateles sp.]